MTGIASGNNAVSQPDDVGLTAMSIQIVNPLAVPGWDEEIRQIPGNSFFHGTPWLRVLQDSYGFEPVCLVARQRQDNRISGLLVLVEVKSWLTGKRGVGMPFADFCPLLAAEEATADALWQKALELGRERGWKTLEIRGQRYSTEHGAWSGENRAENRGQKSESRAPHPGPLPPGEGRAQALERRTSNIEGGGSELTGENPPSQITAWQARDNRERDLTTNQHELTRKDPTGEVPAKDAKNTEGLTGGKSILQEGTEGTEGRQLPVISEQWSESREQKSERPAKDAKNAKTDFTGGNRDNGDARPEKEALTLALSQRERGISPAHGAFDVPSLQFYEHVLDLSGGADFIFKNLEGSNRRAIRKAEASGLTVNITDTLAAMQVFHQLYCLTRQKHGLPPQPFKFFAAIHKHIISKGLGFIAQANIAQQPVASAVFFTAGNEALYKYGASDHACQELRANNLVMWSAIKSLIDKGFKTVHFGRTSLDNDGLRRFKNSWNSAENLLSYYCYNFRQSQMVKQNDQAQGWHNRVFRCLPITLARVVGAALYRHTA